MHLNEASISSVEEVAKVLQTDLSNGLTCYEARERLKRFGSNRIDDDSSTETVPRFIYHSITGYLRQFLNPLIQLLILCVIVSLAIGEYENAISVMISIILVCTISYVQERRADKSLEKLNKRMPSLCKVKRENQIHEMEACCLVPGDIVYLEEGQKVPADVRLLEPQALTINESNLTGETLAQRKVMEPLSEKLTTESICNSQSSDDPYYIFQNVALMGTMVETGHSKGVVICTGKSTRYGEVFCMLKSTDQPRSPLQVNIDQLSIHLVVASCTIIAVISIVGIVQQRPALEVSYYAISLAVTAIPEGLPVVVAVIMALGVLRLGKQKTIVKSLNSIETLGCIQVLCADKTGTLTRNDMTLTDIVTSELHSLSSDELEEMNNEECRKHMTFSKFGGKMYSIGRLMEVGTLCNNASVDSSFPDGLLGHYIGQATECAIMDAAIKLGFGDSRTKFDRLEEIPFNSSSRRMVVQCKRRDLPSNSPLYYVKGAWEYILQDCTHYYECGLVKPKTKDMWSQYERVCSTLGSQGLRVLGLATGPSLDELSFVGIIGINNALREGLTDTVNVLKNDFNIEIKMITGDSRATAIAVGRSLELIKDLNEEDRATISGEQIQTLLDSDMDDLAKAHEINSKTLFYRVNPIQKSEIIGKLQQLDKVVAMTGDGVNDVISIKRSNLSLAMGSGADVCKEIADVILVDDDLSAIIPAIIEGKGIYSKIQSFMNYQISISMSLVVLVAISYVFRTECPYTVIQLLFINILVDGPPAQALGVERIDGKELNPNPRNVRTPILSCHLFKMIFILTSTLIATNGVLYYFMLDNGKLNYHARAILFTCFVFCSVFSSISSRSKRKTVFESKFSDNKELLCCCIVIIIIQLTLNHFQIFNNLFNTEPLTWLETLYLFLYSASVLAIIDTVKVCLRLCDYLKRSLVKASTSKSEVSAIDKQFTRNSP